MSFDQVLGWVEEYVMEPIGKYMTVGGAGYMLYGGATGNAPAVDAGFALIMAGVLVDTRTEAAKKKIDKLEKQVSDLEGRIERD
jgi:hypothetical protein